MALNRSPPPYPQKFTIALFGKRTQFKNIIGEMILDCKNHFDTVSGGLIVGENNSFKILNASDFYDEECLHPDQQIIDFMAFSQPGPNLFILAIDSENTKEEKVVNQISNLQETFGGRITAHLVILVPDIESLLSLNHLKEKFNVQLAMASENLANDCKKWCQRQSFLYDYTNYSQDVVIRRKKAFEKRRFNPSYHHGTAGAAPTSLLASQHAAGAALENHIGDSVNRMSDNTFNIVLLGLTGTGKSASANTILAAGNSKQDSRQLFKSEPSSMPVTTHCQVRTTEKLFGMHVRVVDTPDFFHEQLKNSQAQVEECRKYCQQGQYYVVLLVLQLGRFTDAERGLLEKLENKLGWKIRESTIVVLTHGEDLGGNLKAFIKVHEHLRNIVEMCGNRYHLFNNKSKNTKQVTELIKKIPNYENIFPKYARKSLRSECLTF